MNINCDYTLNEGCGECKFKEVCSLIQPTNINLETIRKDINFKLKEVSHLNESILTMKSNIKSIQQGLTDIMSIEECEEIITEYQTEKLTKISEIRDLRRRERNILKVLLRRMEK